MIKESWGDPGTQILWILKIKQSSESHEDPGDGAADSFDSWEQLLCVPPGDQRVVEDSIVKIINHRLRAGALGLKDQGS